MDRKHQCLVVDDEMPAHQILQSHILQFSDLHYAGSAYNGKEAMQLLIKNAIDILFLDVTMPLLNGIELMQSLSYYPAIIITSASTEHAYQAYQLRAIDYMLKPITLSRFMVGIEKARSYHAAAKPRVWPKDIQLKNDGDWISITWEQILFVQSLGNYIKVFLRQSAKPLIVYSSLKDLITKLPADQFIQLHKSYVVRFSEIRQRERDFVVLKNNSKIPVGRKYDILLRNKS
jgi:DNA-binding LytR/AlgR family response regulator